MTDSIKRLKELVDSSDNIVFFGGAGVSTESGIPDFRSTGGLYHQEWKYPPEVILSHTFYESNPEEFFRFYRAKLLAPDAKPNAAHKKLAEWEAEGRLKAVITQNIDGLHQAAGSRNVLELHGSVHRNHCQRCGKFYGLEHILRTEGVPRCSCGGIIKPDVVLYDVLGDVVCGGFAAPIREGYAEKVLIVTSGEKMALYAANNISSAVRNFEDRSYARIFGIVLNHRNVENETEKVQAFAEKRNIPIVGEIPRSDEIIRWEDQGKTVIEGDVNSEISEKFFALARKLLESGGEAAEENAAEKVIAVTESDSDKKEGV